jgi:hypothetical protein
MSNPSSIAGLLDGVGPLLLTLLVSLLQLHCLMGLLLLK